MARSMRFFWRIWESLETLVRRRRNRWERSTAGRMREQRKHLVLSAIVQAAGVLVLNDGSYQMLIVVKNLLVVKR